MTLAEKPNHPSTHVEICKEIFAALEKYGRAERLRALEDAALLTLDEFCCRECSAKELAFHIRALALKDVKP